LIAVCLPVDGFFMTPASLAGDSSASPTESISVFDTTLVYVSDYVSFIGREEYGFVTFALEMNRGRDGESCKPSISWSYMTSDMGGLPRWE